MKKLFIAFLFITLISMQIHAQDVLSSSNSSVSMTQLVQMRSAHVMVNTDYPVTPGDNYQVSYLLSTDKITLPFYVEGDYTINLAYFGKLNVKGMTFAQLKRTVENKVLDAYSDSVPSVTITSPGTFNILIKGEVKATILVPAWSFDRLSTIINEKTTAYASIRKVEIKSADGSSQFYDLYRSTRYGELDQDPFVKSGDTVIVHPYIKRVNVTGEVKRPGTYEILEEETFAQVLEEYANGLTGFADASRITVKRLNSASSDYGETIYLDIEDSLPEDFLISDLDNIEIAKKLDHQPVVYFQGAIGTSTAGTTVSNKVPYPIMPGEKLSSAARSLKDQFTAVSDLETAFIIRGANGEKEYFDIEKLLLKGEAANDSVLRDGDTIVIPFRQYLVYVGGQVVNPGAYPYIVNKTWEYYIGVAGGFDIDNHIGKRVRITDVYGDRHLQDSRIIEPEDSIYAPLNHPIYWLREYGDDLAVIATSITSTIVLINFIGELADVNLNLPVPE